MIKCSGALNIFFSNPTLKKSFKSGISYVWNFDFSFDSLKRGIQMVFFLHHLVISIYFLAATEFSRQCAVILIEFHTASEVWEVVMDFHHDKKARQGAPADCSCRPLGWHRLLLNWLHWPQQPKMG